MTSYLLAALGVTVLTIIAAIGKLIDEEVRGWLELLPYLILRFAAAMRLDPIRQVLIYEDEWLPELSYIMKRSSTRPISRILVGVHFALSLLFSHIEKLAEANATIYNIRSRNPKICAILQGIANDMDNDAKIAKSELALPGFLRSRWYLTVGGVPVSPHDYRRLYKEKMIMILDLGDNRGVPMTLDEFREIGSALEEMAANDS